MNRASILMYHNIGSPPKGAKLRGLYVTSLMFQFQMWYLKVAGFKVVGLDQIRDFVNNSRTDEKLVALTFDDGYQDFYDNAYPILKKYNYPSTVFLVSDLVGQSNTWDSAKLNIEKKLMNWDKIIELQNNGITFGSHTRDHVFLAEIPESHLHNQVQESKRILEERLQTPIDYFCYPYGSHNSRVVEEVRSAGYKVAVTVNRGYAEPDDDPLTLKRVLVKYRTHPLSFIYKLHSDYEKGK